MRYKKVESLKLLAISFKSYGMSNLYTFWTLRITSSEMISYMLTFPCVDIITSTYVISYILTCATFNYDIISEVIVCIASVNDIMYV